MPKAEIMTPLQLAKWVADNYSYRKFRPIEGHSENKVAVLMVGDTTGDMTEADEIEQVNVDNKGFIILDAFTASAIMQVHDALNDENKQNLQKMSLLKMADVCMKLVSGGK